jgi:riboflavin synthase
VFTGIVRERGRVTTVEPRGDGVRLTVAAPQTATGAAAGDSVAVSGICLTVERIDGDELRFWASPETLDRTKLGRLTAGDEVNLEPALRAGDPLGGHIVQGHVDGVGRVRETTAEGEGVRMWVDAPPEILRYCVEKGSVTVDGVSLTVAALDESGFELALVAYTLAETTLGTLPAGEEVNLEADVLGKYVDRLLAQSRGWS